MMFAVTFTLQTPRAQGEVPPAATPDEATERNAPSPSEPPGARDEEPVAPVAQLPTEEPEKDPGFLRGPELRYDQANVFLRLLADIPALPTAVVDWTASDWIVFGGVTTAVGGLMLPLDPTPDIRFDAWLDPKTDPWMPDLWAMKYQIPLWAGMAVGALGTWGGAALYGNDDLAESMSLLAESVGATQFYHLLLKLSIGRGDDGKFRGFPASLELFPKGTPGGHFATIYAFYGAIEAYWKPVWYVRVGMHTLIATMAITHFINDRHYLSDQIWGAAMGFAISQWVVRHRSTRYRYDANGRPARISVVPNGRGLALRIVTW